MVLNKPLDAMDDGAPLTEPRWLDADPHVDADHDELVVGVRVEVEFTDDDGTHHVIDGDVKRFDAWTHYSGSPGGHNILLRTDAEVVREHDEDGVVHVNTRTGSRESVVEADQPGAGFNTRIASDTTAGENIQVRVAE